MIRTIRQGEPIPAENAAKVQFHRNSSDSLMLQPMNLQGVTRRRTAAGNPLQTPIRRKQRRIDRHEPDRAAVRYVRTPFEKEPDFKATSVNYRLDKLLASAQEPA